MSDNQQAQLEYLHGSLKRANSSTSQPKFLSRTNQLLKEKSSSVLISGESLSSQGADAMEYTPSLASFDDNLGNNGAGSSGL